LCICNRICCIELNLLFLSPPIFIHLWSWRSGPLLCMACTSQPWFLLQFLNQKNLYIVGCVQCIWDITADWALRNKLCCIYTKYIISENIITAEQTHHPHLQLLPSTQDIGGVEESKISTSKGWPAQDGSMLHRQVEWLARLRRQAARHKCIVGICLKSNLYFTWWEISLCFKINHGSDRRLHISELETWFLMGPGISVHVLLAKLFLQVQPCLNILSYLLHNLRVPENIFVFMALCKTQYWP
jgi:hypothetical protein